MTRIRILLVAAALLCATTALAQNPVWPYPGQTAGPAAPLDTALLSTSQPQFVNPLPIPVDFTPDKTTYPGWDYYEISMKEVTGTAPFLSVGAPAGTQWLGLVDPLTLAKLYTPVWGYGQTNMAGGPLGGAATYPSMNIRGTRGTPIKVKWVNEAPPQHLFCQQPMNYNWPCAIDRTLMGTKAVGPWGAGVGQFGGGQQADNAMVIHFHGGEIPPNSDGFAELWFGSAASAPTYSPGNAAQPVDPPVTFGGATLNLVRPIGNAMLYNYPMVNQAATLWYHDHALGKTRINVAAGPAGFFPIMEPAVERAIWGAMPDELGYPFAKDALIGGVLTPGCSTAGILAGNCYDLPIVFQDRDFNAPQPGSNLATINYPNGLNWTQVAPVAFQTPLTPGGNPTIHPQWVPEYFGTFPIVNGMAWPFLNVEPRKYRFHFLAGSNARCWSFTRSDAGTFTVIGNDQGYLPAAVTATKITMCPGERYDVIMDFTGALAGTKVFLGNNAPAPFPAGIRPSKGDVGKPLAFKIVAATALDKSFIPTPWNPVTGTGLPTFTKLTTALVPRQMVLNEQLNATTLFPMRVQIDGKPFEAPITETPKKGTTETWWIINTTGDAHPIHLHLVKFQIVGRRGFDQNKYSAITGFAVPGNQGPFNKVDITPYLTGAVNPPAPFEAGWKDTAISYPGEVLQIIATWDASWSTTVAEACVPNPAVPGTNLYCGTQGDQGVPPAPLPTTPSPAFLPVTSGPYVWHCHIVDHEDNEMMRPTLVLP